MRKDEVGTYATCAMPLCVPQLSLSNITMVWYGMVWVLLFNRLWCLTHTVWRESDRLSDR